MCVVNLMVCWSQGASCIPCSPPAAWVAEGCEFDGCLLDAWDQLGTSYWISQGRVPGAAACSLGHTRAFSVEIPRSWLGEGCLVFPNRCVCLLCEQLLLPCPRLVTQALALKLEDAEQSHPLSSAGTPRVSQKRCLRAEAAPRLIVALGKSLYHPSAGMPGPWGTPSWLGVL